MLIHERKMTHVIRSEPKTLVEIAGSLVSRDLTAVRLAIVFVCHSGCCRRRWKQ